MTRHCVVGAGKLGLVWALYLEELGREVTVVDKSSTLIQRIEDRTFRTWEPDVEHALRRSSLRATMDLEEGLAGARWVDIFVPTPSDPSGAFDASIVMGVVWQVTECAGRGRTGTVPLPIVVKSTTWPGQMHSLRCHGVRCSPDLVRLYYAPELVALGEVFEGMRNPALQILGVPRGTWEADPVIAFYRKRTKRTHVLAWEEAELSKLCLNACLSLRSAFARQVDRLASCFVGASGARVMETVGDDPRIGSAFHRPGPMPGGPCLPRDTEALVALADYLSIPGSEVFYAPYKERYHELAEILVQVKGAKTVGILGLSYKARVPMMDGTLVPRLVRALTARGTEIRLYGQYLQTSPTDTLEGVLESEALVLLLKDPTLVATMKEHYDLWKDKVVIDPWGQL